MRLTENNYNYRTKPFDGENPFDPGRVGVSYYDGLLQDPEYYRKRKGVVGSIEYMTPEEYFHACAKGFNSTFGAQVNRLNPAAVQDVKDVLDRGISLTVPYLNYSENSFAQEGRHRMKAVADIFGWDYEVPVLVVRDAPTTMEAQEVTVYNALAAYPRYADKYGRNDAWFELKYNFHLTNDELIWIINHALKKGWIDEYGKEAALRILGINSIEESYQVLDELNPKLWQQDGTLRPEVRGKLIEIQDQFIEELNENSIPVAVLDAWIVGSNASYNYTDQSDLDLHIIVDSSASSCDAAVLQILYNYFKSNFNSKYDISIHGIDVELYIEDVNSNAVSNGIYSLKQDKWIKKPIKADIPEVQIDSELLQKWVDKYNNVVAGVSAQTAQSLVNELYLLRKQFLATEGEYGQGNLIFKEFRNNGYLDKLKEIAAGDKSKELSLESRKLKGDVSMKNTLYEAIINNASREIRCYDRTTGEELCFNLEEGVKDGYTLFIKTLAEKLNYEGDGFNSTVNLWEFCNNNTDVLEKMFENATTVRECYDSLVQFINEGVSIKEGARLAKCLSNAGIITESLKEEKAPSYSTELMQKLTDLPEGSIIEIRNTEGTVDKAFRKVSTSAGIWVCTKEGTAESAYTTDLATDYKDDNWMIDYVQAEGLKRTSIKSSVNESVYMNNSLEETDEIVDAVLDKIRKNELVKTVGAEYINNTRTLALFLSLKNGKEGFKTIDLDKINNLEHLRRRIEDRFELMIDTLSEEDNYVGKNEHVLIKKDTSMDSTTNKLAEAPNEKKEVFVYKAMDINGNGVFKVFYDDGTYEILKGSDAYERNFNDYDKRVSMETLRHATAPPKSAIRQSRRTLGDSKSTVRENVSIQESVSGDASKLTDVLSIAKKIGIETIQDLLDFQNRHKGEDLLVALKDYEKEFDADGEGLDENIFTKRKERKKLYKEISNIDDIIPTDGDGTSDDKSKKADSRYKMKVCEGAEQKGVYYISYKANDVYQAILAKASSEQEAKDKVQKKVPNAEILSVRVAYAGDRKPGIPVVEDTLKRNGNLSMSDYIEEGDTIYSDGQDYYITEIKDVKDVDGYELAVVEVSTGANIGANVPKKLVGNQNYYYFVLLNGDVEWGVCDTYEEAKEWYDGVEDGYYEEDGIEQFYHDSSEDELRKMGAFDNLNDPLDEGVDAADDKAYVDKIKREIKQYLDSSVFKKDVASYKVVVDNKDTLRLRDYYVEVLFRHTVSQEIRQSILKHIKEIVKNNQGVNITFGKSALKDGAAVLFNRKKQESNNAADENGEEQVVGESLNESPDTFGIPTDDELDAEYQKKKELIAKKRELAQSKYDSVASLKVKKMVNKKTDGFINNQAIMKGFSDLAESYGLTANRTHSNYIRFYDDNILIESEERITSDIFSPGYNICARVGLIVSRGTLKIESYITLRSVSSTRYVVDEAEEVSKELTVSELLKLIKSKVERVSKRFSEIKDLVKSSADNFAAQSKQYSYNSRDRFFQIVSSIINGHEVNDDDYKDENGEGQVVEESLNESAEYRYKTKQGWPVLKLGKSSKWGDPVAIIHRVTDKWEDYVVAWMYDVESGTWGQGHYMFNTQEEAEEYAKKEYGNNVFESVNK